MEPPPTPAARAVGEVLDAIMQAVRSALPELENRRHDPIPAPERWERDCLSGVPFVELRHASFEDGARADLHALL